MAEALSSHDGLNLGDRPLGKGLCLGWRLVGTSGDLAMGQGGGGYGRPNVWQRVGTAHIARREGCKQSMASLCPQEVQAWGLGEPEIHTPPQPCGFHPS